MHSADFFRTTSPRLILEDYLKVNEGVASREVLTHLAPFALRNKIGRERVTQLFNIGPRTPVRHRPWFIWNSLRLAGLDRHWYAYELNHETLKWKGWVRRIERDSTEEERERWRKLLYVKSFPDPNNLPTQRYWTKGGSWHKNLGISEILVMRRHLERPDCWYKRVIREDRLKLIEQELWTICNPDKGIMPTQYHRAVNYVRSRVADFAGRPMSMKHLPWFFQMDVVDEEERWYQLNGRVARHCHLSIEW